MKIKSLLTKSHPSTTQEIGNLKEKQAIRFLQKKGFKLITQNYHCRYGEIDIIMQDNACLIFVEVRYRESSQFGGAAYSITPAKQNKLIKSAEHYLQLNPSYIKKPCRIDVIAIDGSEIQWISNAIER